MKYRTIGLQNNRCPSYVKEKEKGMFSSRKRGSKFKPKSRSLLEKRKFRISPNGKGKKTRRE